MIDRYKPPSRRITGGTTEEQERIKKETADRLGKLRSIYTPFEISKKEQDVAIITATQSEVARLVRGWGGEPHAIPPQKIHILKRGGTAAVSEKRFRGGYSSWSTDEVWIDDHSSGINFALTLAHELFHLQSPKALQISLGEKYPLRSGIETFSRKDDDNELRKYFNGVEEAIVTEASALFYHQYVAIDRLFEYEHAATQELKQWLERVARELKHIPEHDITLMMRELMYVPHAVYHRDRINSRSISDNDKLWFAAGLFDRLNADGLLQGKERYVERQAFNQLVNDIANGSNGRYSVEEIKTLFFTANFSSGLAPLRHLAAVIESTLGEGLSTVDKRFLKEEKLP